MDKIFIHDLMVRLVIGTNEEERRDKQDVLINITLFTDLKVAGDSDNLDDTLNYRTINKRILAMADQSNYFLVEALAERIASLCLEIPKVQRVQVRVEKPGALRFARSCGVEITRNRE